MVDWLTDPYSYSFMQRALAASLMVGTIAPLVGVWIVLRRLAYLGDAMSHATLGGVAVAYLAGWSVTGGAIVAGLVMAVLMALLAGHPRLREDAIIGIAQVSLFAGGVLIISRAGVPVDLSHFLFGSITTVNETDLALNGALAVVALGGLALGFNDLLAASFDPVHARLVGVPVGALRYALFGLLALTVVLALQTVGLLMAVALLVVPAAAARLWTSTVAAMSALAVAFGISACVVGLTLSFHASSAPGATIALVAVALLAVSFAATLPRRVAPPAEHAAELAPGHPERARLHAARVPRPKRG